MLSPNLLVAQRKEAEIRRPGHKKTAMNQADPHIYNTSTGAVHQGLPGYLGNCFGYPEKIQSCGGLQARIIERCRRTTQAFG